MITTACVGGAFSEPDVVQVTDASNPYRYLIRVQEISTVDESTEIGLENLHNCLNASGCVYNNDPAVDPEVGTAAPVATDKFIVFGYSQSAVVAALVGVSGSPAR